VNPQSKLEYWNLKKEMIKSKYSISVLSGVTSLKDSILRSINADNYIKEFSDAGRLEFQFSFYDVNNPPNIILGDPGMIIPHIDNININKNITWIQSTFAGVNTIVNACHSNNNIILSRIGEGFGPQMSQYVFGWILALQNKIELSMEYQQRKLWNDTPFRERGSVTGKTLGVMGVGNIGSNIATTAKSFGMNTIGYRSKDSSTFHPAFDSYTSSLNDLIASSDYIVNTLPSTPSTRYLLSNEFINEYLHSKIDNSSSKQSHIGPIFINVGRGDIISSSVLIHALDTNVFQHAVLDVVEIEPLPQDNPLWIHPKVSITPHISAISTPELISEIFIKNLRQYLQCMEEHHSQNENSSKSTTFDYDSRDALIEELRRNIFHVVDYVKGY
jgi:phosphoglycerate dehydrogenase-like enzyme